MPTTLEPLVRFTPFNFCLEALDSYFPPAITVGTSDAYRRHNLAATGSCRGPKNLTVRSQNSTPFGCKLSYIFHPFMHEAYTYTVHANRTQGVWFEHSVKRESDQSHSVTIYSASKTIVTAERYTTTVNSPLRAPGAEERP